MFYFRGLVGHDPLPVGKLFAAGAADLIRQELDYAFVNPVVVRFDNPFLVSIAKPKQVSLIDRIPKPGTDFGSGSGDTTAPDSLLTRIDMLRPLTGIRSCQYPAYRCAAYIEAAGDLGFADAGAV